MYGKLKSTSCLNHKGKKYYSSLVTKPCHVVLHMTFCCELHWNIFCWRSGMHDRTLVNHIMYAYDLVVFSSSSAGLQGQFTTCPVYGTKQDTTQSVCKNAVMIYRSKEDKYLRFPDFKQSHNNRTNSIKVKISWAFYYR